MWRPAVTVVTPLYNYARYVEHTIRSVLRQTFDDFEYIIVDDGSTDGSSNLVPGFTVDGRVKLIRLGINRGESAAKNIGITAARGEFIATIDADDMLTIDSLEQRVDYLRRHYDCDAVHGRSYVCYGPGDFVDLAGTLAEELWLPRRMADHQRAGSPRQDYWDTIHAQGVMARRRAYERVGLYDEDMRWKSDREMWFRMLHHGCRIDFLDAYVAIYRRHDQNMSASRERRESNIESLFWEKCSRRSAEGITAENTPLLDR
jgi:glycosyltransferase involved in cell wall biosynthesis